MDGMDEATITRLIREALSYLSADKILGLVSKHINIKKLKDLQPITKDELIDTFVVAGFAAGIEFSLRNLEARSD